MAGGLVERLQHLLSPSVLPDLGRRRLDSWRSRPWRRAAGQCGAGGAGAAGAGLAPDCTLEIADCRLASKAISIYNLQFAICNGVVVSRRNPPARAAAGQPDAAKPTF